MDNSEIARSLGKAGGTKTLAKYGKDHYKKIIKARWDRVRAEAKKTAENSPIDK